MNLKNRLEKLETLTAKIPRSGAELIREIEGLPASQAARWLDARSDDELTAMLRADGWRADFDNFTVAELEQIVAGDMSPLEGK
jgi:hypothetical protein